MTFIIGTAYSRNAGYFKNDDTASGGKKTEADIRTCPHCQALIKMQEWDVIEQGGKGGGWCSKCFAPTCRSCAAKQRLFGCLPFMQQLENQLEFETKYIDFLREAGLVTAPPTQPIFTGAASSKD